MSTKQQAGFGAIGIIIVIVVLVAVGLVGWKVFAAKDKPASDTATSSEKSDLGPADTTTPGGDTTYLTINEWGVKFALTADTSDAYYDDKTSSSLDSMSLRVHSLDSEDDCKTGSQSVASIFRVDKDAMNDNIPDKKYSETNDGQTIGDYFYFIQSSQYMCTDKAELQELLQAVRNGFNTASPTIEKS